MLKLTLEKIILLGILLILPAFAIGKTGEYFIDSLLFPASSGDMLSNTTVDHHGTLWLGTYGGYVFRYNGSNDSTGFKSPASVIKQDRWDRAWTLKVFENDQRSSGYLDLKTGQQKKVIFRDSAGKLIEPSRQISITSSEQDLWLLTDSGELYSTTLSDTIGNELILTLRNQIDVTNRYPLSASYSRILEVDNRGKLWLAFKKSLFRFDPETGKIKDYSHYLAKGVYIEFGVFVSVSQNNTTWVVVSVSNQMLRISADDRVSSLQFPLRLHNIQYDQERQGMWCASTNGLYFLRDSDNHSMLYQPTPWQDAGIPSTTIRYVDLDKDNNLWITSAKGIHVIRNIHKHVRRIVPDVSRGAHSPSPINQVVLAMTKQNQQILWWTNRRQELVRYDQVTGRERVFPIRFREQSTFGESRSIAFSDPYVLIITNSGDLIKFDTRNYRFKKPESMPNGNVGNANTFIDSIPNREGRLWLTGMRLRNNNFRTPQAKKPMLEITYWDSKQQALQQSSCQFKGRVPEPMEYSVGFFSYHQYKDQLWMVPWSSEGNLVFKVSLSQHICEIVRMPGEDQKIEALLQLEDNAVWLIHGLFIKKINLLSGKIEYSEKIPVEDVDYAIEDDSNIMIYGEGMLWRYQVNARLWEPLFVSETILDYKSGIRPFFDWRERFFYLPSHQGILEVDTRQSILEKSPTLRFTTIQIGNHKTDLTDTKQQISVPYDESIKVSYLATPLVPSKLSFFRYRLSADDPWVSIARDKQLVFNHLPLGDLKLEMQVSYDYNTYGNSEFLTLNVLPPWWRSTWAYFMYAFLFLLAAFNATKWIKARERFHNAQLMVGVFENTSEGLCVLSSTFEIIRINQALQHLTGWIQHQSLKPTLKMIYLKGLATDLGSYIVSDEFSPPWQGETYLQTASGKAFYADIRIDRLGGSEIGHYILVLEDISERQEQQGKQIYLARHDALTQLPNRLFFNEFIEDLVAKIDEGKLVDRYAMVMFDLDDFKTVNDSLGHEVGDVLLQEIAVELRELLRATLKPEDSEVFRLSGDEFLILTPAPIHQQAQFIAWLQLILEVMGTKRSFSENEIAISTSLGVTFFPDNSTSESVLLQQADMAMYLAKKQGKNKFALFDNYLETEFRNRLEIEKSLNNEIAHNGLVLHFQPKVNVKTGKIIGVEALSRWQLISKDLLFPGQFLPLIRTGKMEKLFGLKVIAQACRDAEQLLLISPHLKISINVSPKYLNDMAYINAMCLAVEQSNIPTSNIMFEILEDVGIENKEVLKNLIEFRNRKIAISIDDFGTGYSSLSHLHHLSADELKIDKSFLENVPGNAEAEYLILKIMDLIKNFSTVITCEGVENKEQLDFITAAGCDVYQGYYFSKPLPLDQVIKLISENQREKRLEV